MASIHERQSSTESSQSSDRCTVSESDIASAVQTILRAIGENPDREGLMRTPHRVAKALQYLTQGYHMSLEAAVHDATFEHSGSSDLVIVRDIAISSLCEHHLLPFTGKMHIGYAPRGRIIGLSKMARIADLFSRRLQVQERLTEQVAHAVDAILKPDGVAVVVECAHICMAMRGVRQAGTVTTTECAIGTLRDDKHLHRRFLGLIGTRQ
ncbi:GTP cyclohydrolase I [Teratosphaeria destructans]|uniref:GTP cyclohydrolase 1 n=1 Tax=Teratosphaeria destructans TaxID=418781 RepID=A0A9W7T138_9PEZI|nr:GTP cyclohydrolase I [Teratosphaeria destructans]